MRFGIVGTNWITEEFIKVGKNDRDFHLNSVYSRDIENARLFAKKHGSAHIFNNLGEMAASGTIDAVYIASPNSLHAEQAELFLNNKVAVLCEKPAAATYGELYRVIECARRNNTLFMEAMITTLLPEFSMIKEYVAKIGVLRHVFLNFCQYSSRYDLYRAGQLPNVFNPFFAGGSLMDIGVYPLYVAVSLFSEPEEIHSFCHKLPSGVDGQGTIIMDYKDFNVTILHSKITESNIRSAITGENGSIEIKNISKLNEVKFLDRINKTSHILPKKTGHGMKYELKHFISLFKNEKVESGINSFELSLKVMKLLDKIREITDIRFPADFR